jgi:alkylation response protein AidB-like acyl-CoA dehydrogenase
MGYMNEERLMIQQTARQFSMKEVLPVANRLDPIQGEIPLELRQKLADMGYFGITHQGEVRRPGPWLLRVLPDRRSSSHAAG